jgi:release factor glutamine methyltransferase
MNLQEATQLVKDRLTGIYDEGEAGSIAVLLVEDLTGFSRSEQLTATQTLLNALQSEQLNHKLERLAKNEPIQYVTGKAWFYGLPLYVNKHVLIPRPETEELVHWIVQDVKKSGKDVFNGKGILADETKQLKIMDVGTGSGCIALALKNAMPRAEVWGCDTSDAALNVARRNGSELNIRVDFQGTDFLDIPQQKQLPTVDIVVSNPPYVPMQDRNAMHSNVVDHEPHVALFVPDEDPLIFYRALAAFGEHRLYDGGSIYMEIHESAAGSVTGLFKDRGYVVETRKDMQGKDRMVKATRAT